MEFFPLWSSEEERRIKVNWVAVLSCAGSLLFSVAIWAGVYRAVEILAR